MSCPFGINLTNHKCTAPCKSPLPIFDQRYPWEIGCWRILKKVMATVHPANSAEAISPLYTSEDMLNHAVGAITWQTSPFIPSSFHDYCRTNFSFDQQTTPNCAQTRQRPFPASKSNERTVINNISPYPASNSFNPREFFQFADSNCALASFAPALVSLPGLIRGKETSGVKKGDNSHPMLVVSGELSI